MSEAVRADLADRILTITLRRPERRNAMTRAMIAEFVGVLDEADAVDEVSAVVVTGAGTAFCVGADLTGKAGGFVRPAGGTDGLDPRRDGGGLLALRLFSFSKPVVAAVNGDAAGVGASLLLPMDVRLAVTSARFGFVQTRRGIAPEGCASWFLPRLVGVSRALEWTLSGRVFGAEEALAAGLVQRLCQPEELLPDAVETARQLVQDASPLSVAVTRRMMWHALTMPHPMDAHRMESALVRALGSMPDAREGIAAFLEKRTARFASHPSRDLGQFVHWWPTPAFDRPGPDRSEAR